MKKIISAVILCLPLALIYSCSGTTKEFTIYITFDSTVDQIQSGIPIKYEEEQIGRIEEIRIDKGNFIAKASIDEGIFIPFGASFIVTDPNFFGDYYLYADLSQVWIEQGRQIVFSGRREDTIQVQAPADTSALDFHFDREKAKTIWELDSLFKSIDSN